MLGQEKERHIYLRIEWWMAGWVKTSLGLVKAECWARRRRGKFT